MANKKKNETEETVKKSSTAKKTANTTKQQTKKTTNQQQKKKSTTSSKTESTPKKETVNNNKKEEIKETEKIAEKIDYDTEIDDGFSTKNEATNTPLIIGIIVILVLMVILICVAGGKGSYNKDANTTLNQTNQSSSVETESASIKDDEKKDLTSISIDEYLSLKKSSSKYSVIYIGRPTCSHCVIQKPIMEHLVYKDNVTINYLNTDDLSDSDITKLRDSDEYFESGWGTPLTLIVKDDKIVDKIEGEASISTLEDLFKKYDLISE